MTSVEIVIESGCLLLPGNLEIPILARQCSRDNVQAPVPNVFVRLDLRDKDGKLCLGTSLSYGITRAILSVV